MVTVRNPTPKLSDELYKAMQAVLNALFDAGDNIVSPFLDLLSKRQYPDYYQLIKEPRALNPIQQNVKRKMYTAFRAFTRDCTLIFHNAKVYNRPSSDLYKSAELLEGICKTELGEFAKAGTITQEDSTLPYIGELPPPSPEASAASPEIEESVEDEEDDEEEDEEDDDEEEDEEEAPKKRRGRPRKSITTQPRTTRRRTLGGGEVVKEEDVDEDTTKKMKDDPRRKRGRPPRVETPMEIRAKNIQKALKKFKDDETGENKLSAFDKLPEKKVFPEYYQRIGSPISMDIIKKNLKRRVYGDLDQFVKDMELMFDNAKAFNEDDSQLNRDAVLLQKELRKAAAVQKAITDEELAGTEDGFAHGKNVRIPLDRIEHKGEIYKVGDWIHLVNPNDPNKPTVAQIFRTWKDPDGQIWINACWYYRPEQTVHWVEKRFYQDEVVKTGQYRDHSIDEVIGKCFVMFFTRYSRGRPKGVDENKTPIYVCESRYNETEKHFNRIKTWKSCVPDAVRGEDYEVDLFEKQRVLKKVPSPIAHLLPPNAREGDTLPDAKMGVENAPPVVGAVFKRARREADSPPPEPTPPPPPPMPTPAPQQAASSRSSNRRTSDYHETMSMTEMYKQAHQAASVAAPPPPPTSHQTPQTPNMSGMHHQQQLRNPIQHYTPGTGGGPYPPPMLQRHPSSGGSLQSPMIPPYSPAQHHPGMHPQQQPQQTPQQYAPAQPPKPPAFNNPPMTWTLPDQITSSIPPSTAARFLRNEEGQILWFSVPPLDLEEKNMEAIRSVGHSVQYLARRKDIEAKKEQRRAEREKEEAERKRKREEEYELEQKEAKRLLLKALRVMSCTSSEDA